MLEKIYGKSHNQFKTYCIANVSIGVGHVAPPQTQFSHKCTISIIQSIAQFRYVIKCPQNKNIY